MQLGNNAFFRAMVKQEWIGDVRLKTQLDNRKKLGYNRHARRAVRSYYGLPHATSIVADKLIDWKNGDEVGTLSKRLEWRWHTWTQPLLMPSVELMQHQMDALVYGTIMHTGMAVYEAAPVPYRHGKSGLANVVAPHVGV